MRQSRKGRLNSSIREIRLQPSLSGLFRLHPSLPRTDVLGYFHAVPSGLISETGTPLSRSQDNAVERPVSSQLNGVRTRGTPFGSSASNLDYFHAVPSGLIRNRDSTIKITRQYDGRTGIFAAHRRANVRHSSGSSASDLEMTELLLRQGFGRRTGRLPFERAAYQVTRTQTHCQGQRQNDASEENAER